MELEGLKPWREPLPSTGLCTTVVDDSSPKPELLSDRAFTAAFGRPVEPYIDAMGDVLDQLEAVTVTPGRTRWPIVRRGERAEIQAIARRLINARDGFRCVLCGDRDGGLELDHVVPWSAGGPDVSENLRTLCAACNNDRSNYRETYTPRLTTVTVVCNPCLVNHDDDPAISRRHDRTTYWRWCPACMSQPDSSGRPWMATPTTTWCGTCTAISWCDDLARMF